MQTINPQERSMTPLGKQNIEALLVTANNIFLSSFDIDETSPDYEEDGEDEEDSEDGDYDEGSEPDVGYSILSRRIGSS